MKMLLKHRIYFSFFTDYKDIKSTKNKIFFHDINTNKANANRNEGNASSFITMSVCYLLSPSKVADKTRQTLSQI